MKFMFVFLLLMGCGEKTIYTDPATPNNLASSSVQTEIDEELTKMQGEFEALNVKVDLKKLPVVVAPLPPGVVGRCQYGRANKGIFIILSPVLFTADNAFTALDAEHYEKDFVRVLLHEIGHCYFRRMHEAPEFLEVPGNSIELRHEGAGVIFDKIPTSVMPAESIYRMPKALRSYYISELVGKAELESTEHLEEFTEYHLLENHEVKDFSDTVEPAEE